MTLWLIRCGRHGEYETDFLENGRVLIAWEGLTDHLKRDLPDREAIFERMGSLNPDASTGRRANHAGQVFAFAHRMEVGDWVVVPTKRRTVHVGEIRSGYRHHPDAPGPLHHSRGVDWIEIDVPRTAFDQDLLNSFGAIQTVCQIAKNDAEARVRAMAKNGWKSTGIQLKLNASPRTSPDDPEESADFDTAAPDLEDLAQDQLARTLYAKFKGHGMELLVKAVLEAQGFTVHHSATGPDGGIDLLAAPGTLGFGTPRICVQVKSQDSPLDRPALDQLVGTMQHVQADQGLLVCWGGFKKTIHVELPRLFFKVRLWDQNELIQQFLQHYERFDDDLKAAVPLKRVWVLAGEDDGAEQ